MTDSILIVDDSSFIVEGLVTILKKNYRTLAGYGGQQCLDILKKEKPSIIILDIMMEPMDGWETLARIKENPDTRKIPVLMFSAKKISAKDAEEHRIGIDDFITKPVTPKKLIEAIEKVLARQKTNRLSIEAWRSSGIGEDRIENYTSLMTSIEVDMSLLQNMKVQHSLVHTDDKTIRMGLETVITAIEKRIDEEHVHELILCRDMEDFIANDSERKGNGYLIYPENGHTIEATERSEDTRALILSKTSRNDEFRKSEMNSITIPVTQSEPNFSEVATIHAFSGVVIPAINTLEADSNDENTGSGEEIPPQKIPYINSMISSDQSNPENAELDVRVNNSISTAEIPETFSGTRSLPAEPFTEKAAMGLNNNPTPPVPEQIIPALRDSRPFTGRTLDNTPLSDEPLRRAIGSGTDTTISRESRQGSKSQGDRVGNSKKMDLQTKMDHPPDNGFISRIISAIFGLFSQKRK